jgi:hypothetical protein
VHSYRINLDGLLLYSGGETSSAYTQLFRNGVIECVNGQVLNPRPQEKEQKFIPYIALGHGVMECTRRCFGVLQALDIQTPIAVAISLTETEGYRMATQDPWQDAGSSIRELNVFLPEIIIGDFDQPITKALKPAFDLLWNACGKLKSIDFDVEGNWVNTRYPFH